MPNIHRNPRFIFYLPDKIWQKEKPGTDLFHFNERDYLLVIDYLLKCPQLALLHICNMCDQTERHGISQMVFSANGPCYGCKEFQKFAVKDDFYHVISSQLVSRAKRH